MESIDMITCSVDELEIDSRLPAATAVIGNDVITDDDELPLVRVGPFDLVVPDDRRQLHSSATDADIEVIVGTKSFAHTSGLMSACRGATPAFDDVTVDRYPATCFVIPTAGNHVFEELDVADADEIVDQSAFQFDDEADDNDDDDDDDVVLPVQFENEADRRRTRRRVGRSSFKAETTKIVIGGRRELPPPDVDGKVRGDISAIKLRSSLGDGADDDVDNDVTMEFSRRQFHGGGRFIRFRYPTKFHRSSSATNLGEAQVEYCFDNNYGLYQTNFYF